MIFSQNNDRITQASTISQSKCHFSGHMGKIWEMVRDREAWCATVHEVTELDATWQLNKKNSRHIDAPESNEIGSSLTLSEHLTLFSSLLYFFPHSFYFLLFLVVILHFLVLFFFCLQQILYTRNMDILVQVLLCLI